MATDHPDGWEVQVYHAIASHQVLLMCGVPQTFFIGNTLLSVLVIMAGHMLYSAFWWRVVILSLGVHGIAMLGTAYEAHWLMMWWRYLRYRAFYEG